MSDVTLSRRNPLPLFIAAVVIVGLVALDWLPAMRGLPLLLLVLAAAVQSGRELAFALPALGLHPSAPVMSFLTAIILLHVAYFRGGGSSAALELVATVVVAMFTLVIVAAVGSDVKERGFVSALRDLLLATLLSAMLGGGFGFALLLQTRFAALPTARAGVTPQGTYLVAVVLACYWLASAAHRLADPVGRRPAAGLAARLVAAAASLVAGVSIAGLRELAPLPAALFIAVALTAGSAIGQVLFRRLAAACRLGTFRAALPHQVAAIQPFYERYYEGGLTDYAAPLALALPLVYACSLWTIA